MKIKIILITVAVALTAITSYGQDAGGPPPAGGAQGGGPGHGPGGFHLLPPHAEEQLNVTADQKKQLAALEAEVKAKLEKILTPEQLQQLKQMRPPRRQGGPGGGGPGGGASGASGDRPSGPPLSTGSNQ